MAEQSGPEISVTTSDHPPSINPSDILGQASDMGTDAPPVEHGDHQYDDEALKLFGGFGTMVSAADRILGLGEWNEGNRFMTETKWTQYSNEYRLHYTHRCKHCKSLSRTEFADVHSKFEAATLTVFDSTLTRALKQEMRGASASWYQR